MLRRAPLAVVLVLLAVPSAGAARNELTGHPSPYLAMHADNPVQWQRLGPAPFERARREGKPVYLSIGYFSCHWCHVMERESYRSEAIARVLNEHYVPIKVDRELQPALDQRMQEFMARTQGYSGWPTNIFLTPEGYPLIGVLYLPPQDFGELLLRLHERWARDRAALTATAERAAQALVPAPLEPPPRPPEGLGERLMTRLVDDSLALADTVSGGFGQQAKFPSAPQLLALLERQARRPEARLAELLRLTLDQMATQGLRDQLAGGFFRYTVDPTWQTPHFEKMLYDNALLAEAYLKAGQVLDARRYTAVGRDTLDFIIERFAASGGGYIASFSAVDAGSVEGGYYLWRPEILGELLTADERAVAERAWGLSGAPVLEAGHLPVRARAIEDVARALGIATRTARARLAGAREKLLAHRREARALPRDPKVVAAWNGLTLRALVVGARLDEGARYREAAGRLADFLADGLREGDRLVRARRGSERAGDAGLEDYAYAASGLAAWAGLAADREAQRAAAALAARGWREFFTPRGWRLSADPVIPYAGADAVVADGPMPSPSAALIEATLALPRAAVGDHHDRAVSALGVGVERVRGDPYGHATHIGVLARYQRGELEAGRAAVRP